MLEDAAVLGKTFTQAGLAALSGSSEAEVEPILASLVRKELLTLQTDPRSPERGQYGFLQALVQRVAYDTLARRDRKARHLAAAGFLEREAGLDSDEIAEVIAAHYVDAHAADPEAGDADDVKAQARDWLTRAGERAAALAAPEDARRAFDRAAGLAEADEDCARLLERAGEMALAANDPAAAEETLRDARSRFEAAGLPHDAARATAQLGVALWELGRGEEALEVLEPALAVLAEDEPDENVAQLAAQVGRIRHFQGDDETAMERIEFALGDRRGPRLRGRTLRGAEHEGAAPSRTAQRVARAAPRVALDRARARPRVPGAPRLQQPRSLHDERRPRSRWPVVPPRRASSLPVAGATASSPSSSAWV